MPKTPNLSYSDAYSRGQVAYQWKKPNFFVELMISQGKLELDDRGLVTTAALGTFYKLHGVELD